MESFELRPDSILKSGEYRIVKVLGKGGFGITYQAWQNSLERYVAIKQFLCLPTLSDYKAKFLKEAKLLATLNNPHIVKVFDVFEEYGTAFYVMEYLRGGSLDDILEREGRLPVWKSIDYCRQIAFALDYLHTRPNPMNHLDVKPANVLINENGEAVLVDFGLTKRYDDTGSQTSTTPLGISYGYSPLEQYERGGVSSFSPSTDIYALGATLYRMVTGLEPPIANTVFEDGIGNMDDLPYNVAEAIRHSMAPNRLSRPQSIPEFLRILDGSETKKKVSSSPLIWVLTSFLAVVCIAGVYIYNINKPEPKSEPKPEPEKLEIQIDNGSDTKTSDISLQSSAEKSDKTKEKTVEKENHNIETKTDKQTPSVSENQKSDEKASSQKQRSNASVVPIAVGDVEFKMILVSGGSFIMGATEEQGEDPKFDEEDMHSVSLSDFYIGQCEVTQCLWEEVMGNNPSLMKGENMPVENVSWNDCQTFISRLNEKTGKKFKLPSEAQWEYAARGGCKSSHYKYSGSNDVAEVAWVSANSMGRTHDVGTKKANELGLFDMSGNVQEWCSDSYMGAYNHAKDITGRSYSEGQLRVYRGGSSYQKQKASNCRVSARSCEAPNEKNGYLGLRLCMTK